MDYALEYRIILTFSIFLITSNPVKAIGCYKCATTGNDTTCADPFNPGLSTVESLYETDCKSGIEGRTGYFPARYCLKVSGFHGKFSCFVVRADFN